MNDLIRVTVNENQEPIISGRELHDFLEVSSNYTTWFDRMKEYGFIENNDFNSFEQICSKPQGGRPAQDHAMKIDTREGVAFSYTLGGTQNLTKSGLYFIILWSSVLLPHNIIIPQ